MATKKPTPEDQAAGRVDLKTVQAAAQTGATADAAGQSATDTGQASASASQGTEDFAKVPDLKTATAGNADVESSQAADQAAHGHEGEAAAQDGKNEAATADGGPVTSGEGASNGIFPDISEAARAFASVGQEKRRFSGSSAVRRKKNFQSFSAGRVPAENTPTRASLGRTHQ